MTDVSRLNVTIDGDESGLVAAANRSEAALNDLGNAASRSGGRITAAGQQAKAYGGQARMAGGHTANLAAQFNDIGLMLASGQSPLMLAMQQGTQVNQVLSQMGTSGVSRVGALKTAFLNVVQPANLVTFAIIAGGAALIQWGFKALSAGRKTRDFEDALEDLSDIASDATHAANILTKSAEDLREEYGDLADQVRALAVEELELARVRATISFRGQVSEIRDMAASYEELFYQLRQAGNESRFTATQTEALEQGFRDLRTAANVDDALASFAEVTRILEEANVPLGEMSEGFVNTATSINEMQQLALELENAFRRAAAGVSSIGDGAAGSAEQVKALRDGLLGQLGDPKDGADEALLVRIESLQEALATEEELEMASFQRRQELLEHALEKQLITQQQYQEMMQQVNAQHADAMSRIDSLQHGSALAGAGQFFGAMENVFASGNKRMLKIAKVFGAVEALINSWRAYAQVLADPSLPFYAKFAAAAAVLASGLGAVSAIQGASAGGGGGASGGYGGSRNAGGANNLQVGSSVSRNVAISLEGDTFSGDAVRNLINKINEAVEDGAIVRLV